MDFVRLEREDRKVSDALGGCGRGGRGRWSDLNVIYFLNDLHTATTLVLDCLLTVK